MGTVVVVVVVTLCTWAVSIVVVVRVRGRIIFLAFPNIPFSEGVLDAIVKKSTSDNFIVKYSEICPSIYDISKSCFMFGTITCKIVEAYLWRDELGD